MKILKYISTLAISLFLMTNLYSQDVQREFGELLQSYFQTKDKAIVAKSIAFLNDVNSIEDFTPALIGFFGAVFSGNQIVKNEFSQSLNKISDSSYRQFFRLLLSDNIDSIYSNANLSPEYNDMNWASFFATGDVKFINNIISNLIYCNNLTDLNLFLTGHSAKWSLSSNARQYDVVNNHLTILKEKNQTIVDLLEKKPEKIQEEMITILKDQKAKGIWK